MNDVDDGDIVHSLHHKCNLMGGFKTVSAFLIIVVVLKIDCITDQQQAQSPLLYYKLFIACNLSG